jgi:hypothetical protein
MIGKWNFFIGYHEVRYLRKHQDWRGESTNYGALSVVLPIGTYLLIWPEHQREIKNGEPEWYESPQLR